MTFSISLIQIIIIFQKKEQAAVPLGKVGEAEDPAPPFQQHCTQPMEFRSKFFIA